MVSPRALQPYPMTGGELSWNARVEHEDVFCIDQGRTHVFFFHIIDSWYLFQPFNDDDKPGAMDPCRQERPRLLSIFHFLSFVLLLAGSCCFWHNDWGHVLFPALKKIRTFIICSAVSSAFHSILLHCFFTFLSHCFGRQLLPGFTVSAATSFFEGVRSLG